MNTQSKELSDGRVIGCAVFEVAYFPNMDGSTKETESRLAQGYQQFCSIIQEFFKLDQSSDTLAELLWITDKTERQTFRSRIRVFCIVRKIGTNAAALKDAIEQLANHFATSFASSQYRIDTKESFESYIKLIGQVDTSSLYSIVKAEKCAGNAMSMYPYYYSDVIPFNNTENFASIVAALSQQENCCISFQLFPTRFTMQEQVFLNEVTGELGRIVSGFMQGREMYSDMAAREPYTVLSSYQARMNSPLFQYNILVFGNRSDCTGLSAKIVSLLQSGQKRIVDPDFTCLDLSGEKVNLSAQYLHYPWNINSKLIYTYRNKILFERVPMARTLFRLPYIITAEEAAAFFRLPVREKTMAALQSNQSGISTEMFEESVLSENNIKFGKLVSHDISDIIIGCPEKTFTKHAMIVGTPGSGKTTFSENLLLQFNKKGIPFLAIEPTKHEYRAMLDSIPDLLIFTPGNNDISPFIINPFIPPHGIRLEQYIPSLASAFQAAFSMQQPLDMLFLRAIRVCYAEYGWRDYSTAEDTDITLFGMHEFIRVFKKMVEETNYDSKLKGNLQSAGVLRLMNLIEQNSNIYDTIHTVPIEDLLNKPTVLELNAIENIEQKSLLMALILINICTFTKHSHKSEGRLQNIILIDEAHVLFGTKEVGEGVANPVNSTTKALQDMVAEIRSYGTGVIIADQSPSKIGREILACTDIKVAFRLVEESERKLFAGSTDLNAQALQQLAHLEDGEAFFYYSKLNESQLLKTPDIRAEAKIRLDVPDDEIHSKMTYWNTRQSELVPYAECHYSSVCKDSCDFKIRADAEHYAIRFLREYGNRISDAKLLRQYITLVNEYLTRQQGLSGEAVDERLPNCLKIRLLRKVLLEKDFTMSPAMVNKLLEAAFK